MKKNNNKQKKRNKIITIIGWASLITSIPWVIGIGVIINEFKVQRYVINHLKPKKKQSDLKIKTLETKKEVSTTLIGQLETKNTKLEKEFKKVKTIKNELMKNNDAQKQENKKYKDSSEELENKIKDLKQNIEGLESFKIEKVEEIKSEKNKNKKFNFFYKSFLGIEPELVKEIEKNYNAKIILDKLDKTLTTTNTTKTPNEVRYSNIENFINNTAWNLTEKERSTLNNVPIFIEVSPYSNYQIVTFMICKTKISLSIGVIKVNGFKSAT